MRAKSNVYIQEEKEKKICLIYKLFSSVCIDKCMQKAHFSFSHGQTLKVLALKLTM